MFIPILITLIIGDVTGIAETTNIPAVEKFGDKYLSAGK